MAYPRYSTVYDFTNLRIHRDGTRVAQSDENYRISKSQRAVKDANGYWIARDAGGLGTVKTRSGYVRPGAGEGGEHDLLGSEERKCDGTDGMSVENEHKLRKRPNIRTERQRRFGDDMDFLDFSHSAASSSTMQELCLPVPSSDLLKSIHYFAASFYTDRGQLSKLSKQEKRVRERAKSVPRKGKRRRLEDSLNDEGLHGKQEHGASASMSDETRRTPDTLHDIRRKHRQDMYKVMDGSALMALGMIVQEHVAQLVRGRVPEGWEDDLMQDVNESEEEMEGEDVGDGVDEDEKGSDEEMELESHQSESRGDVQYELMSRAVSEGKDDGDDEEMQENETDLRIPPAG
ncbi:hypothetical protein AX15_005349 [Amanita polypyramis BW_CC]|nr:hypothetical protein AX15_005349 [Amanita polypyramis BW_CC]